MKITKCPPGSALDNKPNYKKQRRQNEYDLENVGRDNISDNWIRANGWKGTRGRSRTRFEELEATVKALSERVAKLES